MIGKGYVGATTMPAIAEANGTSAMFKYVDALFPAGGYRKLAVHFEIDDIKWAAASVDARMAREMERGRAALEHADPVPAVVAANLGGPYGSDVLPRVRADSERVWAEVQAALPGSQLAAWQTATIEIVGADGPWTARVPGHPEVYTFGDPP